jgi:hypothetical protein
MLRNAKWAVLAALAGILASPAAGERTSPQRSEGVLEAVDTQMRTVEIRNGGAREKIAFDEATEIVRNGEKLRPSKLGRGSRLRIDWTRRGPRIVATRIEVVAARDPAS